MKYQVIKIDKLLEEISRFSGDYVMYSKHNEINDNEDILVSLNENYDLPDSISGFKRNLSCADIEDIMLNLSYQISKPKISDYVKAINFYIENDAFIDLEEDKDF